MFRILHLDRKTNVEVLEIAKVKQTLVRTIQERKLQYFGHLIQGKKKTKTTDRRGDMIEIYKIINGIFDHKVVTGSL